MSIFKGSGVAIVTPFNENGVNFDKLKELLDWHVKCGTDAIIVCATTGEAPTMTEDEKKAAIKFTVDTINKRIPVIASTGSNCTKNAIDMSKWAESIGVDAVLSITPYYNKTTQRGIYEHFKAISKSINVPIIIYNVPSRTGLNVAPKTLYELMEFDNIRGIKEASGDISQIATMKSLCRDRLELYSGNDDQIIPILSLGGLGVISTIANIMPKEIHEMCMNYLKGDTKKALDMQLDTLDLMHALFMETNPIPIKTAMNLLKMNVGDVRLPLCEMSPSNLNILKDKLHKQKLL